MLQSTKIKDFFYIMTSIKLNDQQVHGFIRDGYIAIEPKLSNDFHADIFAKIEKLFDTEGNPGNNLLARIPELQYIYNDPYVVGALSSIIGEDYYMEPHRAYILINLIVQAKRCIKIALQEEDIVLDGL